jgi:aminoglycoside phosphotransferase
MHLDSCVPNLAQQKKLCEMLHRALVEIRLLAGRGRTEQASDLADVFHNLPNDIWQSYFSIAHFREAFLVPYYRKWPDREPFDYLALLKEVETLK